METTKLFNDLRGEIGCIEDEFLLRWDTLVNESPAYSKDTISTRFKKAYDYTNARLVEYREMIGLLKRNGVIIFNEFSRLNVILNEAFYKVHDKYIEVR